MSAEGGPMTTRLHVRVRGLVQGVGFRPFVHGLAERHRLTGWVKNDDAGVLLEVQGDGAGTFLEELRTELPPLARIDSLVADVIAPHRDERGFTIEASARGAKVSTSIGPDAAPCRACLRELFDPHDRRFRYPFLNCTHCGPRFTITRALPYDRAQTSMATFPMCADCAREYHAPTDRRFHAQPTACPACGPSLTMPIEEIVRRLAEGEIVAVKGVGGFQVACDATHEAAVARLRRVKQRDGKPFAIMFANAASAARFVELSPAERALLESTRRPIVLARLRTDAPTLAPSVAPGLAWLGVMLPSSPLHYLLFHDRGATVDLDAPNARALVMTSANPGGEPLVKDDDEARVRLGGICDAIAGHDRAIVIRCDDPVERVIGGATITLRRGRGATPGSVALGRSAPPILAVGAHLKNAICVTRGDRAFLSQHLGDMDDAATFRFFEETVGHLRSILEVEPVAVAHDLHPDFLSTGFAERLDLPRIAVQHHHAHVAAVLAEHAIDGPCVGLALDGVGLGDDGAAWGGELLRVDGASFTRLGHLAPLPLPGGDVAAREPWRMAVAALWRLGQCGEIERRFGARGRALVEMLDRGVHCPPATSCGRWFDAACGLLGVRDRSGYEGEAPMVLESLVTAPRALDGGFTVDGGVLDLLPLLDALRTMSPAEGASLFHGTLAAGLVALALPALSTDRRIALSGGCVVNRVLTTELVRGFAAHGIQVLLPREAPAGDGGLALGQAWVASHTIGA